LEVKQVGSNRPSPPSPLRDDVMAALRDTAKKHFPEAAILPVMTTGASDGVYLRAAGIPVYGVSASFEDVDDGRAHGQDERILVQSYYDAIAYTYDLMKRVSKR
jgi:acetylornithine deacetylase/succinyl-diaminopimelate desuccinylase-like protein